MVCIPCIVVPVLLFIWHRFLQPILLKFWNPFKKVTNSSDKKSEESNASNGCPAAAANGTVKTDGGISCPFSGKKENNSEEIAGDKKND